MFALVVFYPLKAFDYYGIVALVELVKLIFFEFIDCYLFLFLLAQSFARTPLVVFLDESI